MKEYSLSKEFALVGLDGLMAGHQSRARHAAIRGIGAARLLEQLLFSGKEASGTELKEGLDKGLKKLRWMNFHAADQLEKDYANELMEEGLLEKIQDLLACDLNYDTIKMDIQAYRCQEEAYQKVVEGLRGEILEDGPITLESGCLLWLFRESGCISQLFSSQEQQQLTRRMVDLSSKNPVLKDIWAREFFCLYDKISISYLMAKKLLFKNSYLEGVNLLFPFLERRQAIFIDFVVLNTNVAGRRQAVVCYLSERGHYVQEIKRGAETLIKVDNSYYRIFPMTKSYGKLPVQGVYLVPVYE